VLVVLAATRQDAWERFVARSGLGGEVPATYGEAIAAVIAFADPPRNPVANPPMTRA
jgi:hypothetical protein